ncbi:MAG: tRNA (adenine-N1)-methyltransferase [Anaerolineae bacterium]
MSSLQHGETVLLLSPDKKRFLVRLAAGETFHCHRGVIPHDDVIGLPAGAHLASHSGSLFTVLRPSMEEVLLSVKRAGQIVYPKDIGYILLKLNVVPGATVIEAGTGSGALACAMARYVGPEGRVHSYESRADMLAVARENLARMGLLEAVSFHHSDIEAGFEEEDADALFLDVREPWLYLSQATAALAPGGFFGALVPTVNQVVSLAGGLADGPFADIEISELLLRQYKALPSRVRPMDRLTPHTGYLLFARYVPRAVPPAPPAPGGQAG